MFAEGWEDGLIDTAKELDETFLEVIATFAGAVVDDGPSAADGGGVHLELILEVGVGEGVGEAGGHVGDGDGPEMCAGPFEEADGFLAEGEEKEASVARDERQERFEVKAVKDHGGFLRCIGEPEVLEVAGGGEEGEALILMIPEELVLEQFTAWGEHGVGSGLGKGCIEEELLGMSQHGLEAAGVFLAGGACAMHEEVGGEAWTIVDGGEVPEIVHVHYAR
jgi:hypothetical protein